MPESNSDLSRSLAAFDRISLPLGGGRRDEQDELASRPALFPASSASR